MINFNCPRCGTFLSVPDSLIGQQESCPGCRSLLTVPGQQQPAAPPLQTYGAVPTGYAVYPPPPVPYQAQPLPVQSYPSAVPKPKNVTLAFVLSLLLVGLGQFYNDDPKKGGLMLGIAIVGGYFSGGIGWLGVAVWSAIDAYHVASGKGKRW